MERLYVRVPVVRASAFICVGLLAALAGCDGGASPTAESTASASAVGIGAQFVFSSTRTGNGDLYLADVTSGTLARLTTDPAFEGVPSWSPDGSRVAYVRFARDGSSEIHVINADGTADRTVSGRAGASQILPTWSPDGRQIAFGSATRDDSAIWVVGSDGLNPRRLTPDSIRANDPVWSPDGSLIAYTAGDPTLSLYVMSPDGSNVRRLTPPDATLLINWGSLWSPDGSRLAFVGRGAGGSRQVQVVSRDGGDVLNLTEGTDDKGEPAWSPDGTELAFWSDRDGAGEIYAIPSAGGSWRRLTTGSGLSGVVVSLRWSPDGRKIAVWTPWELGEVYLLDAAGGKLVNVTNDPEDDTQVAWRPAR